MTSLGRLATRGAGVTLGAQSVRFVVQIASLVVLTRILTPHEVGLVAMVTAILNVAEIVRDFGLSSAAVQSPTLSTAERDNLFWLNLAIGAGCSVVAFAVAPVLSLVYGEPAVTGIAVALAGLFVVSGANTQYRAGLSRDLRFTALAATDVVAQVVGAGAGVVAALRGAGYWSIVIQQATFVVITFVANLVQGRWLPGRPRRSVSIQRFVRFGAHLLGTNLMGFVVNNVDNVGVGAVWGSGPLGLYSRAYQLLQVPLQQINAPLSRVVLPLLSRVQDDKVVFDRFFLRFQFAICYTLGLGFAVIAGVCYPLVHILFGPEWAGAAPLLGILAISGIFKGIDSANYQLWVSKGLTAKLLKFYSVSRPLMVLMILGGLPWGPAGVAWGQLLAAVLNWSIGLRYVCSLTGVDPGPLLKQSLLALGVVILPAGGLAWLVSHAAVPAPLQLLGGVLAALAWAATLMWVVPAIRADVRPLASVLRRAARRTA